MQNVPHESVAPPGILTGEITFASPEAQEQRTAELLGTGALVVQLPPLAASMRGRLAEHVEEHVERALAARGAPAPYLVGAPAEDPEARLSEQIFRARSTGATGLALAMGSLSAVARPSLGDADSSFVRVLARTAGMAPLVVLLDDADATLCGYLEPVPITALLACAAPIVVVDTSVDAPVAMIPEPEPEPTIHPSEPPEPIAMFRDDEFEPKPTEAPPTDDVQGDATPMMEPAVSIGVPVAGPNDFWRTWAVNLSAARGPQPLAAFQRLFVESYMPLAHAIAHGVDDPRALRAYDEFRRAFERAYTDAFATFGVTNRRPRLVMDAHDWASKQARLHNARIAHVLVVDSMRWDLGGLVRDALGVHAEGVASLTAETALFAALPTTTIRQLETIARGIDALRAPSAQDPTESLRGRAAETVRRMRVGSREIYKLDLVPAMLAPMDSPLRGGSEQIVAHFDEIADAVAETITRHIETLQPRTLLLVTGDHGFCLDRRGRITHGGASPEEVLVPAYAFLVGDLH